jgi:hypothetical protein
LAEIIFAQVVFTKQEHDNGDPNGGRIHAPNRENRPFSLPDRKSIRRKGGPIGNTSRRERPPGFLATGCLTPPLAMAFGTGEATTMGIRASRLGLAAILLHLSGQCGRHFKRRPRFRSGSTAHLAMKLAQTGKTAIGFSGDAFRHPGEVPSVQVSPHHQPVSNPCCRVNSSYSWTPY